MYGLQFQNITVFGFRQVSNERISLIFFLRHALCVGVRQRRQRLILHTIHDVYPRINFMNKELSIFQKIHV